MLCPVILEQLPLILLLESAISITELSYDHEDQNHHLKMVGVFQLVILCKRHSVF